MLSNDEDWALKPENSHPKARALLTEAFYWDCTDSNSPLGNDTGSDIFSFYRRAIVANPDIRPIVFLESLLVSWDMLIDDWMITTADDISRQLQDNPHKIPTSDDAVIGLAFGMYIIHGYVDPYIRDLAIKAVQRETTDILIKKWRYKTERLQRLKNFAAKLYKMESEIGQLEFEI